jgi:hypothetical protein
MQPIHQEGCAKALPLCQTLSVMKHDTMAMSLSTLLDKAESSLRDHLADWPESRHLHLKAIYQELRAGLSQPT